MPSHTPKERAKQLAKAAMAQRFKRRGKKDPLGVKKKKKGDLQSSHETNEFDQHKGGEAFRKGIAAAAKQPSKRY